MTTAQKIAIRLSEIRQALNELSGKDGELTEAEEKDLRSLSTEYPKLEARHRAAMISESTEEAAALDGDGDGDGEDREHRELRSRSRLARFVAAAMDGVPVQGAEAEFSAAAGCPGSIPLELFEVRRSDTGDPERRAVTPAPGYHGRKPSGDRPGDIRPKSAASWLGIEMPTVPVGDAGYPGAVHVPHRRRRGEKSAEADGSRGRVHGHDGATAAESRARSSLPYEDSRRDCPAWKVALRAEHRQRFCPMRSTRKRSTAPAPATGP